jgi:hypothetical protein
MRYRIAGWALAGFVIAAFWAVYLHLFPIFNMTNGREILMAARLTCPISLVGEYHHHGVSLIWVLASNPVVYGLIGLCLEPIWRLIPRTKLA